MAPLRRLFIFTDQMIMGVLYRMPWHRSCHKKGTSSIYYFMKKQVNLDCWGMAPLSETELKAVKAGGPVDLIIAAVASFVGTACIGAGKFFFHMGRTEVRRYRAQL